MFEFAQKMLLLKQFSIEKGKIELLGQRVIIVPIKLISLLIDLYYADKKLEKDIYMVMRESVKDYSLKAKNTFKFKPETLLSMLMDLTRLNGYGDIYLDKISYLEKKALFKVEGLPSNLLNNKYKNFMGDSYWAGITAGALTIIFDDPEIECLEIKCVLNGDKFCSFVAGTKHFLKENYGQYYTQKFEV